MVKKETKMKRLIILLLLIIPTVVWGQQTLFIGQGQDTIMKIDSFYIDKDINLAWFVSGADTMAPHPSFETTYTEVVMLVSESGKATSGFTMYYKCKKDMPLIGVYALEGLLIVPWNTIPQRQHFHLPDSTYLPDEWIVWDYKIKNRER